MCKIGAFLGGAAVGAAVALLLAPQKGEDLRAQIKSILKKYGVDLNGSSDDIDVIAAELVEEIKKN